jgi:hypothetical protein
MHSQAAPQPVLRLCPQHNLHLRVDPMRDGPSFQQEEKGTLAGGLDSCSRRQTGP